MEPAAPGWDGTGAWMSLRWGGSLRCERLGQAACEPCLGSPPRGLVSNQGGGGGAGPVLLVPRSSPGLKRGTGTPGAE